MKHLPLNLVSPFNQRHQSIRKIKASRGQGGGLRETVGALIKKLASPSRRVETNEPERQQRISVNDGQGHFHLKRAVSRPGDRR